VYFCKINCAWINCAFFIRTFVFFSYKNRWNSQYIFLSLKILPHIHKTSYNSTLDSLCIDSVVKWPTKKHIQPYVTFMRSYIFTWMHMNKVAYVSWRHWPVSLSLVASARMCLASSRVEYNRMMRVSVLASCDRSDTLLSTSVLITDSLYTWRVHKWIPIYKISFVLRLCMKCNPLQMHIADLAKYLRWLIKVRR
jgi:hypothetical protein